MINEQKISRILCDARERGETVLLETDGFEILRAMGFETPAQIFVRNSAEVRLADLSSLGGERVVVKVVSPQILHKSDVGGVEIVANDLNSVAEAVERMTEKLAFEEIAGFTINQLISYTPALGNELILGLRWTDDFGAVVTFGAGGIYTEFLTENFKAGRDIAILSPELSDDKIIEAEISKTAVASLLTKSRRGQKPRLQLNQLVDAVKPILTLANSFSSFGVSEFEINPIVVADGKLIALDILIKLGKPQRRAEDARPVWKIKNLLEPESIAVIGVSEKLNAGHIIVNNLLREGFDREHSYVVKPNAKHIEGCRCYSDVASLPERVDLCVLSIAAEQVPETIAEIIEQEKAESMIIIPGGLEEKNGSEEIVSRMNEAINRSRKTDWGGPVINGGNCLGIRSKPGHYDTMFIPEYKLPLPKGDVSPVCIIAQSGGFAISKTNKLTGINPRYDITVGNQMDMTIGDYLTYLKDDKQVKLFAIYVEGFKRLDGAKFLKAAREITGEGRTIVLYRAGRTSEGAKATSSHTASIAGDYTVTRELAQSAGVIVAETFNDFEDLTQLFSFLGDKQISGLQLGAVSNAGYECVAFADNLGTFTLPALSEETQARLQAAFSKRRIDSIVDTHNPLDLTPMAHDEEYELAFRAILEDENVDVGIVGCLPLAPSINTLKSDTDNPEDVSREDSIAHRLMRLKAESTKAWVVVIDAGPLYDPLAVMLEEKGIPVFRTADRAMRLFNIYCNNRMKQQQ